MEIKVRLRNHAAFWCFKAPVKSRQQWIPMTIPSPFKPEEDHQQGCNSRCSDITATCFCHFIPHLGILQEELIKPAQIPSRFWTFLEPWSLFWPRGIFDPRSMGFGWDQRCF
jgi:hypothetical protein